MMEHDIANWTSSLAPGLNSRLQSADPGYVKHGVVNSHRPGRDGVPLTCVS